MFSSKILFSNAKDRTNAIKDDKRYQNHCKIYLPANGWFAISGSGERVFFVFIQFNTKYNYSNYFVVV